MNFGIEECEKGKTGHKGKEVKGSSVRKMSPCCKGWEWEDRKRKTWSGVMLDIYIMGYLQLLLLSTVQTKKLSD